MFLVPVSCIWCAVHNLDTSFWSPVSGTRILGGELGFVPSTLAQCVFGVFPCMLLIQ